MKEEEAKVQQRIPITILSKYEGYLLEGDELTVHIESRVDTHRECYSQENKAERSKKKNTKVKAMELAIVRHQEKTLKMVKELALELRPKTRPKNKLRLNLKKLLNPKLNTAKVTMIDTSSSKENLESSKGKSKGKKPLTTLEESSLTQTKLSVVFLELRDEMLKEQQTEEVDASYSENKMLMDENAPDKIDTQEIPSVPSVSTKLLQEDEDIFRKLDTPWLPSEIQDTTTGKAFDSEKENL